MATTTYRAVQVSEPGRLEVVEPEVTGPPPGKVRIRVEACGVCHTVPLTVEGLFPGAPNDDFSRRLGPQMPASLSITLEGGEVIKGEKGVFDGFWATPMTWDQVRAKFDRLTDGRIDKALGAELAAAAQNIDRIAVKGLTALLGRVSPP